MCYLAGWLQLASYRWQTASNLAIAIAIAIAGREEELPGRLGLYHLFAADVTGPSSGLVLQMRVIGYSSSFLLSESMKKMVVGTYSLPALSSHWNRMCFRGLLFGSC